MIEYEADITVIGAGPGGYPCAIRAAQLGAKVIIVERDEIGGTCLNRGCIPAKAFVESANRYKDLKEAKKFGLKVTDPQFDFITIQKRKQRVVNQMVKGVEFLLKSNKIKLVKGSASFVDKETIRVVGVEETSLIKTNKIVIATGSKTFKVPIPGFDGKNVITSKDILEFSEVPEVLIIIGGGVIGDEFASVFSSFGTKVTIIEMLPHLVPMEDVDVAIELESAFKRQKIKVNTNCKVTHIGDGLNDRKVVTFTDSEGNEQKLEAQYVLLSVGRIPEIEGLKPENAGIELGKRGIKVNCKMETNIPNIYAVGDCIELSENCPGLSLGHPMLAYTATIEGETAAENAITGSGNSIDYRETPSVIFTDPEIASTGLTEEEAKKHYDVKIGTFPFKGIGKAVIHGQSRGFIKIILNAENNELLGCHIIGPHATELIAEATLAIKAKLSAETIIHTQHGHPVLYEGIKEAVLDALGRAIHK